MEEEETKKISTREVKTTNFTPDEIERAFTAWSKYHTYSSIMQEIHCNVKQARQIVKIHKFKDRLENLKNRLRLETDLTWLDKTKGWLQLVQQLKKEIAKVLEEVSQVRVKKVSEASIDQMLRWTESIMLVSDRLARLEAWLHGEPDMKMEVSKSKFEGWTTEEKLIFATTGKRPERFYGKNQEIIDVSSTRKIKSE